MAQYRKKPVIIEAVQYIAEQYEPDGLCWELGHWTTCPHVHTIHADAGGVYQTVAVQDGDWIIPEPDGIHFYPCKPDIFDMTYELVK